MNVTDEQRAHLKLNMAASAVMSVFNKHVDEFCEIAGPAFAAKMLKFVLAVDKSKWHVLPIAQMEIEELHDKGKISDEEFLATSKQFKEAAARKPDPRESNMDEIIAHMAIRLAERP